MAKRENLLEAIVSYHRAGIPADQKCSQNKQSIEPFSDAPGAAMIMISAGIIRRSSDRNLGVRAGLNKAGSGFSIDTGIKPLPPLRSIGRGRGL